MRRDWKAELASDVSTEECYLHPRGLRHPRGAGGRRRHGDAVPRTRWSPSRLSGEGERRISHPGCRRGAGPRRVSARKGFAVRSGAVRRSEGAPALSHGVGFKSDAAMPEARSLDPWQHTQPRPPSRERCSCRPRRARAGRAGTLGSGTAAHPQKERPGTPGRGKPGGPGQGPQRCPRRRSVALASDRPQGGRLQRSRRGEGKEPLSRLTPPTCAARSFARPQDLAH